MWLASISLGSRNGGRLATPLWSPQTMARAKQDLRDLVGPCGDPAYERIFRMQITLCMHRALSEEDKRRLPDFFFTDPPIDLAGGPVEILEETVPGLPTTKPCENPGRAPLDAKNPLLWFPLDCHRCEPCRARMALAISREQATDSEPRYLADTLADAARGEGVWRAPPMRSPYQLGG